MGPKSQLEKSSNSLEHHLTPEPIEKQDVNRENWIKGFEHKELVKAQEEDPDIGPLTIALRAGGCPRSRDMVTSSPESKHY